MNLKTISIISALVLMTACSHNSKTPKQHPVFTKTFFDVIKSKKPAKPTDKRAPASKKKQDPGMDELFAALKKNPSFFKVPVGFEVTKNSKFYYQGQDYNEKESSVYLKQDLYGYFEIYSPTNLENSEFKWMQNDSAELSISDMQTSPFAAIKKISDTQFVVSFKLDWDGLNSLCDMSIDLTKSSLLIEHSCKNAAGKVISESKVESIKAIKLADYNEKLKSVKLVVYPGSLECPDDHQGNMDCMTQVRDESEKDWSYHLK